MTPGSDPGQHPPVPLAAAGGVGGHDRQLNADWLRDQQAHEKVLADCLPRPFTPPRPQVVAVMAEVARSDHHDRVEDLLGDMLRTTPRRLFSDRPDLRDLVHRAVAEELVEPDSPWHTEALNHLEARTRAVWA